MRERMGLRLVSRRELWGVGGCFHLEFAWEGGAGPRAEAGQFFSFVAADEAGKEWTRAYSVAGVGGEGVEVCLNRVGWFSNMLCDLEPGAVVECHGPHGLFVLQGGGGGAQLWVAESTGIAPVRAFAQAVYGEGGAGGRAVLVYGAESEGELLYDEEWRELAGRGCGFEYRPVVGGGVEAVRAELGAVEAGEGVYAYVCGLKGLVKGVREELGVRGWAKRQVMFERYD